MKMQHWNDNEYLLPKPAVIIIKKNLQMFMCYCLTQVNFGQSRATLFLKFCVPRVFKIDK